MKNYIIITLFFILHTFACNTNKPHNLETSNTQKLENITVSQVKEMMNNQKYTIIDVRTPEETALGKISNTALEINVLNKDIFMQEIAKLDKSKPYIIYCRSGSRSKSACQIMQQEGFSHLYNMLGGYNAWQ